MSGDKKKRTELSSENSYCNSCLLSLSRQFAKGYNGGSIRPKALPSHLAIWIHACIWGWRALPLACSSQIPIALCFKSSRKLLYLVSTWWNNSISWSKCKQHVFQFAISRPCMHGRAAWLLSIAMRANLPSCSKSTDSRQKIETLKLTSLSRLGTP